MLSLGERPNFLGEFLDDEMMGWWGDWMRNKIEKKHLILMGRCHNFEHFEKKNGNNSSWLRPGFGHAHSEHQDPSFSCEEDLFETKNGLLHLHGRKNPEELEVERLQKTIRDLLSEIQ